MQYLDLIQESLDYIEEHLKAEITAEELAARAGFSLYHYYRLFHSAVGMPVMQYILRRRLLHGVYAISGGCSGVDAALMYGFDTYAGFYRAFLREFSCTPSQFVKLCRAKRPYRIHLKREEAMMLTHKKAAEILKNWGLEQEKVTDIYYDGTGERNEHAVYVGERYVLKVTANLGKLNNHLQITNLLEKRGLTSAVVVKTSDGAEYVREGEQYFFLTRRLVGKQMTANTLEKARFVGEIIGKLDLALQDAELCLNDGNMSEQVICKALPKVKELLELSESFVKKFSDEFAVLYKQLPRQIIHRDPNPGNIICSENDYGFLDFELSQREVRIFDPCYAATAVLSEHFEMLKEQWIPLYQNMMLGYDSTACLTAEEQRAIPYVIIANQLICTAWFAGIEKYAHIFEVNKKMTKWLIERFEELRLEI